MRAEIVHGLREGERVAIAGALVEHVGGREGEPALLGWLERAAVGDDDRDRRERKAVPLEEPDFGRPGPSSTCGSGGT